MATRVAAFLSFLVAGVLSILADRERWWPVCSRGAFDSVDCLTIQSHEYDFLVPMEPWMPTGNSATLIGLSFLVLSVALGLTIPLSARPRRAALPIVLLALLTAVVGAMSLRAGINLSAIPQDLGRAVMTFYYLGGPVLILWVWAADTIYRGRESLAHHLLYGALFLTTGFTLYFTSSMAVGYQSHDTSPWNQAVGGVLFIIAGLICFGGFDRSPAAVPAEASVELAAN